MNNEKIVSSETISQKIFSICGVKVMLDKDLAELYGVETRELNKAVKRNVDRFPEDFMFQLAKDEFSILKFHFGTSSWGGTRKLPYTFTEQGVAILSSVLRSKRAAQVNIGIMRAFVKWREILVAQKDLATKLEELERKYEGHDKQIQSIFLAIRKLMEPPALPPKRPIGFHIGEPKVKYNTSKQIK